MKLVALSGGIASGKSAVSQRFEAKGIFVADADQAAREAVAIGSDGLADVVDMFGKGVLAADGSLYPCSEFIGLPRFNGGSLLSGGVEAALDSVAFREVTTRDVDQFSPCSDCSIRHFCGSPCPAEAFEMNGGMDKIGAFCEFYKEQVNYALRLIADGKANDYLWDGWDEDTETTFLMA